LNDVFGPVAFKYVDFQDAKTADIINDFAKRQTNGLIHKIVNSNEIEMFLWMLMNTLYFEGQWGTKFNKIYESDSNLQLRTFTDINGSKSTVTMIGTQGKFPFFEVRDQRGGLNVVGVPFFGSKYKFVIVDY